jgi:ABC-2 type transport system ATP-binding protein
MRILTCFIAPSSGSAKIAGFDVLEKSMEVRRRVGTCPNRTPSTPRCASRNTSSSAPGFATSLEGAAVRVGEALEKVRLTDRRRSIIAHLSKGLRQRVGIADAILHRPEIVILDEPTIGLDPTQVRDGPRAHQRPRGSHTVLFSSHILSEVEKICGRVLILSQGRWPHPARPRRSPTRS